MRNIAIMSVLAAPIGVYAEAEAPSATETAAETAYEIVRDEPATPKVEVLDNEDNEIEENATTLTDDTEKENTDIDNSNLSEEELSDDAVNSVTKEDDKVEATEAELLSTSTEAEDKNEPEIIAENSETEEDTAAPSLNTAPENNSTYDLDDAANEDEEKLSENNLEALSEISETEDEETLAEPAPLAAAMSNEELEINPEEEATQLRAADLTREASSRFDKRS